MKQDRRVLRTRRELLKALGTLLTEKEFAAVQVSEIAERADVNRATFYRHYEDKHDLLSRGIDQLIDEILEKLDEGTGPEDSARERVGRLFAIIGENLDTYRPFFGPHAPPEFSARLEERAAKYLFRARLLPFIGSDIPDADLALLSRALTGVLTAVLSEWILEMPERCSGNIAGVYLSFITSGLAGFLPPEKADALTSSGGTPPRLRS
jgi:AcrR family transcriptional regulator